MTAEQIVATDDSERVHPARSAAVLGFPRSAPDAVDTLRPRPRPHSEKPRNARPSSRTGLDWPAVVRSVTGWSVTTDPVTPRANSRPPW